MESSGHSLSLKNKNKKKFEEKLKWIENSLYKSIAVKDL